MKLKFYQNCKISSSHIQVFYKYNIHETLHQNCEIHGQGFNHRLETMLV